MGCDIHLYVEKKIDGVWTAADKYTRSEPDEGEQKGYLDTDYKARFYTGRNYDLFAILADVRNGRGFAGIVTGDGFNPIAEPHGVPADASPEYAEVSEQMGCDGHSHSYFTLRELLDYDWTQETGKQGYANFQSWLRWAGYAREAGKGPGEYCGGVSGPDIVHVDAATMNTLCAEAWKLGGAAREAFIAKHANYYGLAVWRTPYYRAAGSFLSETVPRLLKLAGGTAGADDIRIVFFFDN